MEKLELNYQTIAEDINCDGTEEIKQRLNYLIGSLVEASNYLPDDWGDSTKWAEIEDALLDTQNLLNTIYFNIK